MADIQKDHCNEKNIELVELATDNTKLAFQAIAYDEDLKVSLTNEFKEERKKISEGAGLCKLKREPSIVYSTLKIFEVKKRTGFKTKSMLTSLVIIVCNRNHSSNQVSDMIVFFIISWFRLQTIITKLINIDLVLNPVLLLNSKFVNVLYKILGSLFSLHNPAPSLIFFLSSLNSFVKLTFRSSAYANA